MKTADERTERRRARHHAALETLARTVGCTRYVRRADEAAPERAELFREVAP